MVKHPLLWRILADGATTGNALCGVGAIVYTLLGNKLFALALIFIAIGWDGLDGFAARRSGLGEKLYGRVADSVADTVTFCIAPAVVIAYDNYPISTWSPYQDIAYAAAIVIAVIGVSRLLYYTIRAHSYPYFLGVSTPQNAMAVIFLVLILEIPGYFQNSPPLFLLGVLLFAPWMVLPVRYPKVRRTSVVRYLATAMSVFTIFAVAIPNFRPDTGTLPYSIAFFFAVGGFILLLALYVLGPLMVWNEAESEKAS
jgi:CDP-diacylglycerol--serine O-phosphatidyltransferase